MIRSIRRSLFLGAVVAACAVALAWFAAAPGARAAEPAIPAGAGLSSWFDNGAQGRYVLQVIEGHVPASAAQGLQGTVLTDANCAPDAQGLNHCHNRIVLKDGTRLTVINHHQMSRHHCLRPGEPVRVSAMAGHWLQLQTLD